MPATFLGSIYELDFTAIGPGGEVFHHTTYVANVSDAESAMTTASADLMARSIVGLPGGTFAKPVAIRYNAVKPVSSVAATREWVLNVTIEQRVRINGEALLFSGAQVVGAVGFTVYSVVTRDFAAAAQEARTFAVANVRIPDPDNPPATVAPDRVNILAIEEVASIPVGSTLIRP